MSETTGLPSRKRARDRIAQMIEIADGQLNESGSGQISMRDIGEALGTSRALVYAYFPDQYRLLEAVLERHIGLLLASGIEASAREGSLMERCCACGDRYARHVATHGSAIEIVLREEVVARLVRGAASAFRSRLYRRLAKTAMVELRMERREALALIQLLAVIPGDAGRLAYKRTITLDEALELTERLIISSINAVRPNV